MKKTTWYAAGAVVGAAIAGASVAVPALAGEDETRGTFERRLDEWQRCMREHGFDLAGADSTIEIGPDGVRIDGRTVDAERFRRAQRLCGRPFPSLDEPTPGLVPAPRLPELAPEAPEAAPAPDLPGLDRLRRCREGPPDAAA